MLNKIKFNFTIVNTAVLSVILTFIILFMYIFASYTLQQTSDEELMSMAYQAKRFSGISYTVNSSDNPQLKQDFMFFEEKLSSSSIMLRIYDDDIKAIYNNGNFKINKKKLSDIAKSFYSVNSVAKKEINQKDGKYVFFNYKYQDVSVRICTAATTNDNGELEIIIAAKNDDVEKSALTNLLYVMLLTGIVGLGLSVIGGYYIAGRSLIPIKDTMDSQRQFIADASHELRTPIAVVKTNLELVKSNEDNSVGSQMTWINYALGEADRMDKIVGELLLLSKADLKEVPINKEENDIIFLIRDTIEKLEPLANHKEQRIIFDSEEAEIISCVDTVRFTQLMVIIIDNAVKYSNKPGNIVVKVEKIKSNAIITVKDSGMGIKEEDIDKVFTRFYRGDKSRTNREGSGLGLAIARWVVKVHDGKIKLESEEGVGTTIGITIPIVNKDKTKDKEDKEK